MPSVKIVLEFFCLEPQQKEHVMGFTSQLVIPHKHGYGGEKSPTNPLGIKKAMHLYEM
jgi:hypothetical protein